MLLNMNDERFRETDIAPIHIQRRFEVAMEPKIYQWLKEAIDVFSAFDDDESRALAGAASRLAVNALMGRAGAVRVDVIIELGEVEVRLSSECVTGSQVVLRRHPHALMGTTVGQA